MTDAAPKRLAIDFVSDVSCPWCVIGLRGLEAALERAQDAVVGDIHLHPFELNPDMPREGQDLREHVAQKYGATPEQSAATRNAIRSQAAALGFEMASRPDGRIYNTFDAHRLLHWAQVKGRQRPLKHALFEAYFTDGQNPGDHTVLIAAAKAAGLSEAEAKAVLETDAYSEAVRQEEAFWRNQGIHAVPAIIINGRYLISGAQPVERFEKALRSIAAEV